MLAQWCHACRLEYAPAAQACAECGGALLESPPPERRYAPNGSHLRIVATLPPEEAVVASGRLDASGIPATLRRVEESAYRDGPFHVLVPEEYVGSARRVMDGRRDPLRASVERRRDPAHTRTLSFMLLITAIALGLSSLMVAARWLLGGSPLP